MHSLFDLVRSIPNKLICVVALHPIRPPSLVC